MIKIEGLGSLDLRVHALDLLAYSIEFDMLRMNKNVKRLRRLRGRLERFIDELETKHASGAKIHDYENMHDKAMALFAGVCDEMA